VEGPVRGKLESKISRKPAKRSEVVSPVDESNKFLDKFWANTMGASDESNWICQLRIRLDCKATWGHTICAKDI
jgi:hypothetical protein